MTTTCGICGRVFEAAETSEDGSAVGCVSCRGQPAKTDEPGYRSDLRCLVERAQISMKTARDRESNLEVPPSVREAIRNAEAPIFSTQVLEAGAAARRPRLKLAAFPVMALALAGVVISSAQGSRSDEGAGARPLPSVTEAVLSPQATSEAITPPQEQTMPLPIEPTAQAERTPPPAAAPPVRSSRARGVPALPARPHAAVSVTPAASPAPAPAPDPPSLMQAITSAVHSSSAADRH